MVYRGRNYNIFTLVPSDEAGFGKFRQLIAHLVQKEAVAVVPLRMASCLYLIPNSNLTVNKMGLAPLENGDKPNTQFLHVLIVTPKYLSTKVNGKCFNFFHVKIAIVLINYSVVRHSFDFKTIFAFVHKILSTNVILLNEWLFMITVYTNTYYLNWILFLQNEASKSALT